MYSTLSEGWCLNFNPWGFFRVLFLFFLFWNFSLVQIQAGEGRQISLTQKEKAFVKSHPVILVSNEMDWPPFDFAVGKHPFGLSIDMMNILGARIGIEFKYVNQYTWEELVTLFHNRKIDVLQSVYYNKSRKKIGRFTRAYYRDKTVFVVPADAGNISDIGDLYGKTIAVPKGWAYEPFLKKHYPEIPLLLVGNMEEAFNAVIEKKAHAVIELSGAARYRIKKNFFRELKLTGWFKHYDDNKYKSLHFLVRKDLPELHALLEKALETITPGDLSVLEKKWLGYSDLDSEIRLILTPEEEIFLKNNPVIRVANEMDWPPFDFVKNGAPAGFAIDHLRLIGDITGLEFNFINGYTWSKLLEMGRQGKVDLFPGLWKSSERETFLLFTRSYVELIKVLVTRKGPDQIRKISELKGRTLAMPKGYTLTEIVKNKYPDFTYVGVDNPLEALKLVSLGQADGFVGSLGIINYIIKKHFIDNVSVVSEVKLDQPLPLYMAVRKDLPPLQSILNKAMDCITSRQYAQIAEKWIGDINAFGVMDNLTRDERAYLDKKEGLTVSVVENRPFEFVGENGEYAGIVIDFYRVMADRMGLSLNFVTAGSHDAAKNQVIAGTSDAVSIVQEKPAVLQSLGTTLAYISYPLAIATDSQSIYISALEELKDKKIGVSQAAVFLNSLKAWYPGIGFVEVDNVEKGLAAVQRGELYALVDTAPKIGYYIQTGNMVDLKISGELPYDVKFCTGIAADEKHLIGIFDKAIHSMKKEEKRKIFQTWMSLKYEQKFDYSLLWQIVSVMVVIGLFFLYRNFALSRYNLKLAAVNNELILANQKLEKISYMDGLTGIPNRRNFDSVLRKEWFRCKRNNDWLTVIMIDIDYFKAYNDRYGHLSGDDCLKRVAELIADIPSRPGDFVARYGGEEFVVILPDTDKAGAALIAGKILSDVEKMKIVHEDSDVSSFLTVSLGGACAVPGKRGISSRHLVEEADQQLYKAKENGRNQYKIRGV